MRLALKKYPNIFEAMKNRHIVYNQEKEYALAQEKLGNALVICPESPLNMSRTERNTEKLQRAYDEGRKTCQKMLPRIQAFLSEQAQN